MKLNNIVSALNIAGDFPEVEIKWLLTDSRTMSFPGESLFFALRTSRNDGHQYIAELYRQNLRYFVVSEMLPEFSLLTDAVFLKVDNTLSALQTLAAKHRSLYKIPVVGITGSNGKTIVKEWLNQLMHADKNIVRSPRSYNSQIGVPLSVWGLNEQAELGIFEAGISMPGEMQKLERIICPTIGIFTNLGDAHQENFHSLKQKCEEKLKLFSHAEVLIYNADSKLVNIAVAQSNFSGKLFSWGFSADNSLQISEINKLNGVTEISLNMNGNHFQMVVPFIDDASVENAIHCVACMLVLNYQPAQIAERIQLLEPVAMRLEVKDGIRNCLIINDSYNSDLNSLSIALDFLRRQSAVKNLKSTLVLSDILQSGQSAEALYKTVADLVISKEVQRLIGIGTEISRFSHLFSAIPVAFFEDNDSFLKSGLMHDFRDEVVLLKGSRKFQFENISARLELIAHETTLEVNLNALVDNLNYFRSKIKPETKIMCMVKAYAYGSGSVEVARTLQHNRCDYLAVAVADEGAELRREGIRIPVVVMNPEKGSFNVIFDNNLEPEIYSFRLLESFISAAAKLGLTDYPVHIKIDSGMHRLGFEFEDMDELIKKLSGQQQVKVRSVFSHLAGADEPRFDAFTRQQAAAFTACADKLSAAFPHHIMRHLLNSAGTERFPEFQFDMVRLGIGHYGISCLPDVQLRQVCALKTIILQTKIVKSGETVGYSRNGKVEKEKRIGILPIGYADGFDRKLSNGVGEVLINGKRAKVIGNVSMDLIAVDITGIQAEEGDEVEVFGEHLTISEVAGWLKTIPYEILTSISRRVKRVYFQE